MVVFHVSTFILQLYWTGDHDFPDIIFVVLDRKLNVGIILKDKRINLLYQHIKAKNKSSTML